MPASPFLSRISTPFLPAHDYNDGHDDDDDRAAHDDKHQHFQILSLIIAIILNLSRITHFPNAASKEKSPKNR